MHRKFFLVLLFPLIAMAQDCTEMRPSEEQISYLAKKARANEAQAIRAAIEEFLEGCDTKCRVLEPQAVVDLRNIDPNYLRSKFSIYQGTPFAGGGLLFEIVFKERQDATFKVWVRKLEPESGGHHGWYVLRFLTGQTDKEIMKKITCTGRRFIENPDLNL